MENYLKIGFNSAYLIGIGGVSMSALAKILLANGVLVSGSDLKSNDQTHELESLGATVYIGHDEKNIKGADMVVYTGAIKDDNVELSFARQHGIKTMERSEFLGEISRSYTHTIAISGTHGKTTITSMVGHIFVVAGLNPSIHIGGVSKNIGSNVRVGGNEYFITEACEYKKSLLYLHPECSVVNNIEKDHMDCYADYGELCGTFQLFSDQTRSQVFTGENIKLRPANNQIYTYGYSYKCDIFAYDVRVCDKGSSFRVKCFGADYGEFRLNILGKYNIDNALASIGVALNYNIDMETIKQALSSFSGVTRRNEYMGRVYGSPVICDYAHHPTQVYNLIQCYKEHFSKILVVFQPHTYSRTKTLLKEFSSCFIGADSVYLLPTYPAREPYDKAGDEYALLDSMKKNKNKRVISGVEELNTRIKNSLHYDVVLMVGAGDIYDMTKELVSKYGTGEDNAIL